MLLRGEGLSPTLELVRADEAGRCDEAPHRAAAGGVADWIRHAF